MPPTFRPTANIEYAKLESYHTSFTLAHVLQRDIRKRRTGIILSELCLLVVTNMCERERHNYPMPSNEIFSFKSITKCGAYIISENQRKVNY